MAIAKTPTIIKTLPAGRIRLNPTRWVLGGFSAWVAGPIASGRKAAHSTSCRLLPIDQVETRENPMMMTTQLGRSILASVVAASADSMLARPDDAGGYGDIDDIMVATAARLTAKSTREPAAEMVEEAVGGTAVDKTG
jgi:hypothetical protein